MTTSQIAASWIKARIEENGEITKPELKELAELGNPLVDGTRLNAKSVEELGKIGEIMPGNAAGHYFAEGYSELFGK